MSRTGGTGDTDPLRGTRRTIAIDVDETHLELVSSIVANIHPDISHDDLDRAVKAERQRRKEGASPQPLRLSLDDARFLVALLDARLRAAGAALGADERVRLQSVSTAIVRAMG
jgi:hypothetical protein